MELTVALSISILSIVFTILNFALNRKDKSNKDVESDSYKWGSLDEKLKIIFDKLDKIEQKLDAFDKELDDRIEKAIKLHVREYHQ